MSNDGLNDVLRALGIISALIAELTHAGCRELPFSALQTPREEAEELPPGGLFFTAKRMHDRQSVEVHGKTSGLGCVMKCSTSKMDEK